MPKKKYKFTPEHRAKISASLKGKQNALGPHEMTDSGRVRIRLARLEGWLKYYRRKRNKVKVAETLAKIEECRRELA